MKSKNTNTTKKYAIDVIAELRSKAIDAIGGSGKEPDEEQHKIKAVKNGTAVFKAVEAIAKLAVKVLRKSSCYGHHVQIYDLVETPESFAKAYAEYEKTQPATDKLLKKIDTAYEEAERCIMLGGSDTLIGDAITKLERSLKEVK